MYQYNPILEHLSAIYKMKNGTKRLIDVSHKNARKLAGGGKGKSIPIFNYNNTEFGNAVHKMYDGGRDASEMISRANKGLYSSKSKSKIMKHAGTKMHIGAKAKRNMLYNTAKDIVG